MLNNAHWILSELRAIASNTDNLNLRSSILNRVRIS